MKQHSMVNQFAGQKEFRHSLRSSNNEPQHPQPSTEKACSSCKCQSRPSDDAVLLNNTTHSPLRNAQAVHQLRRIYQMSHDFEELEVTLMEGKYGGRPRVQRAAKVIQQAFRSHIIRRNFELLRQCPQSSQPSSTHVGASLLSLLSSASTADLYKVTQQSSDTTSNLPSAPDVEDAVLDRAYRDWESIGVEDFGACEEESDGDCRMTKSAHTLVDGCVQKSLQLSLSVGSLLHPVTTASGEESSSCSSSSSPSPRRPLSTSSSSSRFCRPADPTSLEFEQVLECCHLQQSSPTVGGRSPTTESLDSTVSQSSGILGDDFHSIPRMPLLTEGRIPLSTTMSTNTSPLPPPLSRRSLLEQSQSSKLSPTNSNLVESGSSRDSGVSYTSTNSTNSSSNTDPSLPLGPYLAVQASPSGSSGVFSGVGGMLGLMTTSRDSGVDADCSPRLPTPQSSYQKGIPAKYHQESTVAPGSNLRYSHHHSNIPQRSYSTGTKQRPVSPIWKRKDLPEDSPSSTTTIAKEANSSSASSPQTTPQRTSATSSPGPRQCSTSVATSQPCLCRSAMPETPVCRPVVDMNRKRTYRIGLNLFNKKPSLGLEFLIHHRFVDNSPSGIARFLSTRKGLSRVVIGEFLGDTQSTLNQKVLVHLASSMDFARLPIDEAMRKFFSLFRLPGESQKISHILEVFANRYLLCQYGGDTPHLSQIHHQQHMSSSADAIFVLAYAVVMLHTDLHSASIKKEKKMRLEQFISNLRGLNAGGDFPPALLAGIYSRVRDRKLVPSPDHTNQVGRIAASIVDSGARGLASLVAPHRRLVCFCRMQEVQDPCRRLRPKEGRRDVFLFNDQLLLAKETMASQRRSFRFRNTRASLTTSTPPTPHSDNILDDGSGLSNDPNTSSPAPNATYMFKKSASLVGLQAVRFESQGIPFGVDLRKTQDSPPVMSLSARTASDRDRFFEDLQECIQEMTQMEAIKLDLSGRRSTIATTTPTPKKRLASCPEYPGVGGQVDDHVGVVEARHIHL